MSGQKTKTTKTKAALKRVSKSRAKTKLSENQHKTITLEQYNATYGYSNTPSSKSNTLVDFVKLLLSLALMGAICWAVYKIVLVPLGEAFVDTVDIAVNDIMGEGMASKSDSRGRKYTHNWANISRYEDSDITAKFYYEVTGASRNTTLGYGSIKGTVLNNSGKDISYASIEFGLYDSNGVKHASCYDNISNLAKDAKWGFDATCATWENGWSYRIEELKWY